MIGSNMIVSTRYAVVMAATVWVPKPFMKFCRSRLPNALTLDWIMGGIPNRNPCSRAFPYRSLPPGQNRSRGCLATAYRIRNAVIAACEITVAAAAPLTPQCRQATNRMSRTTFTAEEKRMARNGARLSPIPRSAAE